MIHSDLTISKIIIQTEIFFDSTIIGTLDPDLMKTIYGINITIKIILIAITMYVIIVLDLWDMKNVISITQAIITKEIFSK